VERARKRSSRTDSWETGDGGGGGGTIGDGGGDGQYQ
jgi:hypothetical protein